MKYVSGRPAPDQLFVGWLHRQVKATKVKLKKSPGLVLALLAGLLSTASAQKAVPVLERVARSLPEREASWRLVQNETFLRGDGSSQASLRWTNGATEVSATVIVHRRLKTAKEAFRPYHAGDVHESFRITGIGDKAYLWPPKVEKDGAYNLRFRKGRVEVWISGESEEVVKRCAQYIAASITPPNKSFHGSRVNRSRRLGLTQK